eukprot:Sspe_Gene.85946::Locus_56689_Transcript_1_3_Confidence_0.400_Length_2347::g.85946::m.85946
MVLPVLPALLLLLLVTAPPCLATGTKCQLVPHALFSGTVLETTGADNCTTACLALDSCHGVTWMPQSGDACRLVRLPEGGGTGTLVESYGHHSFVCREPPAILWGCPAAVSVGELRVSGVAVRMRMVQGVFPLVRWNRETLPVRGVLGERILGSALETINDTHATVVVRGDGVHSWVDEVMKVEDPELNSSCSVVVRREAYPGEGPLRYAREALGGAVLLAMLSLGNVAPALARLAFVSALPCPPTLSPIPMALHPLQVSVAGSYEAGCVAANSALLLVSYLVGFLLTNRLTFAPSLAASAFMSLYLSTVYSSFALTVRPPTESLRTLGILALLVYAAIPGVLLCRMHKKVLSCLAVQEHSYPAYRHPVVTTLVGTQDWVAMGKMGSKGSVWGRRHRSLVYSYHPRAWWWWAVEIASMFFTAFSMVFTCSRAKALGTVITGCMFLAQLLFRPHLFRAEALFHNVTGCITVVCLAWTTFSLYNDTPWSAPHAEDTLIMVCCVGVCKAVLDAVLYVWVLWVLKRPQALQKAEWRRHASSACSNSNSNNHPSRSRFSSSQLSDESPSATGTPHATPTNLYLDHPLSPPALLGTAHPDLRTNSPTTVTLSPDAQLKLLSMRRSSLPEHALNTPRAQHQHRSPTRHNSPSPYVPL